MAARIDADYWRNYARRARALADNLTSEEARQTILHIAETYERLAAEMEQRAARIAEYRIFFVDSKGQVQAQHGFEAEGKAEAAIVAAIMGNACSDGCAGYELWDGARRIYPSKEGTDARRKPPSLDELTIKQQRYVLDVEDAFRSSHWHLARSRKLLNATEALRKRCETSD